MPKVHAFNAVQYAGGSGDVSGLVAPPYDVLDSNSKSDLLARNDRNVVTIDLPHVPAKKLGPPEAYDGAAATLEAWLADGTLTRRQTPVMCAYRQTFEFRGKQFQRCGMACTVETAPFGPRDGGGILAHEQTFSGPKEDRFALMKATATQLSPIFGLHADEEGRATALLHQVMAERAPDQTAKTDDGVLHEAWNIEAGSTIAAYQDALAGEDVFVADGHHRYTTAINYLAHLESQGPVPQDHPARRCMIVLVGMSDAGLAIGPTHRVLGGMSDYTIDAFQKEAEGILDIQPCDNDPHKIEEEMAHFAAGGHTNVFGLIDFATGLCFVASPSVDDPLEDAFGDRCEAWRRLDVALIQHVIVEEICQPRLNAGSEVTWAFPHTIDEVMSIASGAETGAGGGSGFAQLGVIVRPTPLDAVKAISAAGELMPQKSTFFYPKLATGLWLNPLS